MSSTGRRSMRGAGDDPVISRQAGFDRVLLLPEAGIPALLLVAAALVWLLIYEL